MQICIMIYSTVQTACNRILIRKAFWKSITMPSFMCASEISVYSYNENELQQLQRLDNIVYKAILEIPACTASSALRAEIGDSIK